ncbi:MAG: hypothetical protein JOZ72_14480 [Alphaproteobacteria bacterium]|nr:hypothetical protein [Alphaproteobacteria bacterium]
MSPLIEILAVNLLAVVGVALFGWSALTLLLLYWLENLIVGAFNVLKIAIAGISSGRTGGLATLFLVPFFVVHYGMFCFVHGLFIVALFGGHGLATNEGFTIAGLATTVIARIRTDPAMGYGAAVLLAFHAYLFGRYWLGRRQWERSDPFSQMFAPYGRIVVVHLTIMIAGIPVMLLGQPVAAVACLALLKTALETGRAKLFDAFAQNPALALKMRRRLRVLDDHAWH